MYQTRPYYIWNSMIERCRNPKCDSYRFYGAKGVRVVPEWTGRGGFEAFWAHASATYRDDLSLDRIDPFGDYEPGNIRWVTQSVQAANRTNTIFLDTPKGRMCVAHAASEFGIPRRTLRNRLSRNISLDRLFDPIDERKRPHSAG